MANVIDHDAIGSIILPLTRVLEQRRFSMPTPRIVKNLLRTALKNAHLSNNLTKKHNPSTKIDYVYGHESLIYSDNIS